jgi:CBS-domain-containing membrane protein
MALRIFDEKFREHRAKYILQCVLAVLVIALLMGFRVFVDSVALLAALGASSCVAFTMPHQPASNMRHLIGGYVCGAAVGGVCQTLLLSGWISPEMVDPYVVQCVLAGVAVGLAILLMVIMDMEHAPAAAVALGLVLDKPVPENILYVLGGITILALLKRLLQPVMIDLI